MKSFKQYLEEMKKPRWEVPAQPGSTPIPDDLLPHNESREVLIKLFTKEDQ